MHYENKYKNLSFQRENGVLEITLHTNGQSLIFNGHTHEELVQAFYDVGNDRDNRVVILTGAGDAFCKEISAEGFDFFTPEGYDKIFKEGRRMLEYGVVNEVVPRPRLLPRARELAQGLLQYNDLTLRYMRLALTQRL